MSLADAPPITFVHTPDRARAKAFYSDVLGLRVVSEDPFGTVYDLAGTTLRLSTVEGWTPHPHTVLGWKVDDIQAAVAALGARGVRFHVYPGMGMSPEGIWTSPDGMAKVAWFSDPDGNNLSLTQS